VAELPEPPAVPAPTLPAVGRGHAILVDAGYLYASVGELVLGTTSRRAFRVAAEPLIGALIVRAADRLPGELLRMYWYDAARDRVPTVEQRQIATLPHVKVRLGNLNSAGQQKGVDAQVRQDLEVLARHRAVSDVILLAGDEDMVPAVEVAQAYGVRVHVWGVEPPYGVNQAERLIWEADTVDQLDAGFWRPFVESEPETEAAGAAPRPIVTAVGTGEQEHQDGRPLVPTPADVFAGRRPVPHPAPGHPAHPLQPVRLGPDRAAMEEIGARIAARWVLTRGRENVADLLPGPVLPTVIDKELLVEAEEEISRSLRPYEDARRALRDGFWARLHREFGLTVGVSGQPAGGGEQAGGASGQSGTAGEPFAAGASGQPGTAGEPSAAGASEPAPAPPPAAPPVPGQSAASPPTSLEPPAPAADAAGVAGHGAVAPTAADG
jgi:NYN domain